MQRKNSGRIGHRVSFKENRNASATKSGPGRYHQQGDGSRTTEQRKAGAYGRGLRNWITRKQAAERA